VTPPWCFGNLALAEGAQVRAGPTGSCCFLYSTPDPVELAAARGCCTSGQEVLSRRTLARKSFVGVGRLGFFRRNIIVFMGVGRKGGEGWGKSPLGYGPDIASGSELAAGAAGFVVLWMP